MLIIHQFSQIISLRYLSNLLLKIANTLHTFFQDITLRILTSWKVLNIKMEPAGFSETSSNLYQTAGLYVPVTNFLFTYLCSLQIKRLFSALQTVSNIELAQTIHVLYSQQAMTCRLNTNRWKVRICRCWSVLEQRQCVSGNSIRLNYAITDKGAKQ